MPLVLALVAIGTLLSSPVNNGLSRLIETRADVDSLQTTRDPAAFIAMQRQLALHSLSDQPPAWSQFWFGSHPTTLERIAIAGSWRAARIGRVAAWRRRAADPQAMAAGPPWVRGHPPS